MHKGITILSVLIGASLPACTFEQEGLPSADASEENVGARSSALNAQQDDIQPAAAVLRGVRTTINGIPLNLKDLYVFICDNHQLKVRTKKQLFGWNFGGWQAIAPDYPCDSAPTVGLIHNTERDKQDILAVYWRSDEKLMEAWYNKDGTTLVTDLLSYDPGHVPAITGAPMVSDTSDPSKVQIVVKRSANSQVWTIAWTGSAYASLPVKRANGTIATTTGNDFYTTYNAYGREYISVEDGSNHVIYARPPASWGTSYTAWATVTSGVSGLLSIGGSSTLTFGACQSGLAIRIGEIGLPFASCLDTGGTLTSWAQVGIGGADNTVYAAPNGSSPWLYGVRDDVIWAYTADPLMAQGTMPWNASGATSAVMQVKGGEGYVFWANKINGIRHLMVADYSNGSQPSDATVTDLGGNLFF